MNKHYISVFDNEQKLLDSIYNLHNKGQVIELDPMYNKGSFYRGEPEPELKFDIEPYYLFVGRADARDLPIENNSINSMILDPPFMFRKMNKSKSVIKDRYTMLESWDELKSLYLDLIKESSRVLKKNGLLIFKCQDFTNSKTILTHCYVWQWLGENGFYVKDLAILNKENKIYNPKTTQRHFRKTHSYFFVAIKKGDK